MSHNYFVTARKVCKQKLIEFVKNNSDMPLKKLIGFYSLQTGFTPKRILEYLQELEDVGFIELKDDSVKVTNTTGDKEIIGDT